MKNSQEELLKSITSFLDKHDIPYMITGAWSVIYYGRPRASHDIDFVVELHKEKIKMTLAFFKELSGDYLISVDDIEEAVEKKGQFNVLHLPTALKLDFWLLTDDLFDKSRFSRRKKVKVLEQPMWIASAEDTILQKLKWYSEAKIEKHLIDAAFVYQVQESNLDKKYLQNWVDKLNVEKYFKEIKSIKLEDYY